MNIKGEIKQFANGTITICNEETKIDTCIPCVSNGNFNHSYIGETVELVVDETGLATDCINKRHR